jgi:hypothetical protein
MNKIKMSKIRMSVCITLILLATNIVCASNWGNPWEFNYASAESYGYSGNGLIYGFIAQSGINTYEWDAEEGINYGVQGACRVNNSEFYLLAFCGDTGTDADGFLRTLQVDNDTGIITSSVISKVEYDTADGEACAVMHIPNTDKYVIVYDDIAQNKATLKTFQVWDNNGTINPIAIDTQQLSLCSQYPYLLMLTDNIWVIAYSYLDTDDGYLESVWIDNTGIINDSLLDLLEFDTTYCYNPFLYKIDSNTIALAYRSTSTTGDYTLSTYNITNGVFTDLPSDSWNFESNPSTVGSVSNINKLSSTIYAITYVDSSYDIYSKTVNIDTNGKITKSWIDSLMIADGTNIRFLETFIVHDSLLSGDGNGILGVTCRGLVTSEDDGYIFTWNVSSNGILDDAIINYYEFNNNQNLWVSHTEYINQSYYVIFYTGQDSDGYATSIKINTNYISPTINLNSPENGSTIESFTDCNISINDFNGDAMSINWYSNLSGSWLLFGDDVSCGNGTFIKINNNFNEPGKTYWWRVDVIDGLYNTSAMFNFTIAESINNPPEKPTCVWPSDNEFDVSISTTLKCHVIDLDSDNLAVSFYYENTTIIQTINDVTNDSDVESAELSLQYETEYKWYVMSDDFTYYNYSDIFTFTTESEPEIPPENNPPDAPILISPDNNSIDVSISTTLKVDVNDIDDDLMNVSFRWYNDSLIEYFVDSTNGVIESSPLSLEYNTTYSWYARCEDEYDSTLSDMFTFTTELEPEIPENNAPTIIDSIPRMFIQGFVIFDNDMFMIWKDNSILVSDLKVIFSDLNSSNLTIEKFNYTSGFFESTIDSDTIEMNDYISVAIQSDDLSEINYKDTKIDTLPTLKFKVNDSDSDALDITVTSNSSGVWEIIYQIDNGSNGWYVCIDDNMNDYNTTYYYNITVDDGTDITTETFMFITTSDEGIIPPIVLSDYTITIISALTILVLIGIAIWLVRKR